MVGWGVFRKKECVWIQTNTYFSKCFFFTESRGFERKNLVLNYGNILWNCAVFYDHIFFLVRRLQLHNLSHILFSSTLVACFLFFFISQSNFWGFFRAIKSFWLLLFFIDGKLVWNHSSRVHFFLGLPKSQRTYIFLSFLVVFSTIFNSCMHMLAKILKSQNFVFYFIFFAVFVQIKGK